MVADDPGPTLDEYTCAEWPCDLFLGEGNAPDADEDPCCLPTCDTTFDAVDPSKVDADGNPLPGFEDNVNYTCPDNWSKKDEPMSGPEHICAEFPCDFTLSDGAPSDETVQCCVAGCGATFAAIDPSTGSNYVCPGSMQPMAEDDYADYVC